MGMSHVYRVQDRVNAEGQKWPEFGIRDFPSLVGTVRFWMSNLQCNLRSAETWKSCSLLVTRRLRVGHRQTALDFTELSLLLQAV